MEKINVKQKSFGFTYTFEGVPVEWVDDDATVWFTAWTPGDPSEIICQKECSLVDGYYRLEVEEGDFEADPGIYSYELARYEDGVILDPTFTGELEILETAGAPGGEE
jgi:hypothetical protein